MFARQQFVDPSGKPPIPVDPTEGLSGVQKFRAGAGKAFSDIGLGARQLSTFASPIPGLGEAQREELSRETELRRERDAPLLGTGAGFSGNLVGNIAAFAPAGGLVTSFPRAAALGAAEGAIQPAVEGERAFNTVLGGGLGIAGQGAARGLQRAFRPVRNMLSGRGQSAVDLLRSEGVDLDVAQRTGSEGAQRVRSFLGDNPLTSSRQTAFNENARRQFTRAVLRRIGADSDEATPDVLRRATQRIGREIDDAVDSAPPVFDTQFAGDLQRIQRTIVGQLTEADARPLANNINDIFRSVDPTTGQINPNIFRRVRSNLSALRQKPLVGQIASDFEDSLLDSLERSGGNREGLRSALAQWRNWKIIENSIDKGTDKTISPLRLSNTFNQKRNRAVSLRGLGHPETIELAQLAEAGRSVLPETLGNSGTFGRALVGEGVLAAGGFGGALASGQDVGDAAAIGVGAASLPFLLQRAMLSQGGVGNFLSQGANPAGLGTLAQSPLTEILLRQSVISGGLE